MNVVCGHCGKAVNDAGDVGQGLLCPRCGTKVALPDLLAEAAQPPDPDETHVFEAIDVSFADEAREAMKKTSKIHLTCGSCGRHLTIGARLAGKRAKCPSCKSHIRVPYPDDANDFEIEALAMANEETVEELDLSHTDAPAAAAHALHEAESRTVDATGGVNTRREAAKVRHAARQREVKRSRRRLIAYLLLTAVAMWAFVTFLAWPILVGNGDEGDRPGGDNGQNIAATGNGGSGSQDDTPNGGTIDGNTDHVTTKPALRRKPRFRVVTVRVSPFAHDGYFPAPLGRAYWLVTVDIQAGDAPYVMRTAGTQVVVTSMGQEFASLGTPGGGGFLPQRVSQPRYTIAPRRRRSIELIFELPEEYRRGTLVLSGVGEKEIAVGDTFTSVDETKLIGQFAESQPRNLKPLLDQPVMAALQQAGPDRMIVQADDGGFGVRFPASGVTGQARYTNGGRYELLLQHGGARLACKLRLIDGGDRAILHLADEPWQQMTFVRLGADIGDGAGGPIRDETPTPSTRPLAPEDDEPATRPGNNGGMNEPRFFPD